MKRILLTLSVLLSALSIYAEHEYIPYVEDGKVWVMNNVTTLYQTSINGTTEIDGVEYHKLYLSQIYTPTGEVSEDKLHGYIREDDGKVYVRNTSNKRDILLYDFGAQVGEEVLWDVEYESKYVIDSIKTQEYNGVERNVYHVSFYYSYSTQPDLHDVWIEGIGSLSHPVMYDLTPNFGYRKTILFDYCYNYNTDEIFPTDKTPYTEFSAPVEVTYMPMCVPGREYIYNHKDNNKTIVTRLSQKEGYVTFDDGTMSCDMREEGSLILKDYDTITEENLRALFSEKYACVSDNLIYFDYDMHVGDSMCVVDRIEKASSNNPHYEIVGRIVKLKSFENCASESGTRTIYKFDSKPFTAVLSEEDSTPYHQTTNIGEVYSDSFIEGIGYATMATTWNIASVKENGELIYQYGHDYIPVVEPGKAWVTQSSHSPVYYQIAISNKTVKIDGKVYYEVYHNSLSASDGAESPKTLHGYVREEDKKVYSLPIDSDKEILLYDFGALVNDTIHCDVYDDTYTFMIMDDIKTNDKGRNVYYASAWVDWESDIYVTTNDEIWIEGVGIHNTNYICVNNNRRWGATGRPADGLEYCYNYNTREIYPANKTPFAEFSSPVEVTYMPMCVPGREYIYQDNKYGKEWRENTFLSEIFPGYIAYNIDGYYGKTLRENGEKVLRNFADLTTTPKLIDLLNENMTIINGDFVYFDYSLQIGDTLCVVEYIVTALGDDEVHVLNGKVIEVLSIEKIELGAQSLLKYNLQSRPFTAVLSMSYDSSLPPSEWDVTYDYGIEIGDTFDDAWIEGIGYTSVTGDDLIYNLQCVFEEGELIYCAEHEYIPYVKEGQEWVMIGRTGYQQYRIGGVANIDGIDYNEIYHTQSYTTVSEPELFDYVREIDRKVYIGLEGKDRLVYDFGAQAGDTIRYDHLDESLTYYTVVNSVENKYIAGKNRTILDVTHHISYGTTLPSQWIEGIGAHEDIFKNEHTYRLGASSTPDQFYYFYNSAEDIRYPENGEIIDFSAINSVTIDNLAIYRQGDVLMAVFPATTACDAITLYDTTGRVVVAQPIGQGATTASIDITSLPKGIYIARLGNGKGVMLAL